MAGQAREQYPFGITREWIEDNHIAVITTQGDMSRQAVDTWADLVIDTAANWTPGQPMFILHDLSSRDQGLTPYSRERVEDTYNAVRPGTRGAVAVVIRDGVINRLVSLLYFRRRKDRGMKLDERLFTNRAEALAWLREQIKKAESAKSGREAGVL